MQTLVSYRLLHVIYHDLSTFYRKSNPFITINWRFSRLTNRIVSDIAIFVLKRDVKLQLTNKSHILGLELG